MTNRIKIVGVDRESGYAYLKDMYSYNKNSLFSEISQLKKYSEACNLSNSKYIKEVIDDGNKFKLIFKNPVSPKYIYAKCFEKIDEYGNSNLLKIREEYLDKLSIKPVYGIWFKKQENGIDFGWNTKYVSVLGEDLKEYDTKCHPNIKEWFCLGGLSKLPYYNGNDYIEYLIHNILLKPSYLSPFRRGDGNNTRLIINGETLRFWTNEDDIETEDLENTNNSNITKETVMKYFEKPDIIIF